MVGSGVVVSGCVFDEGGVGVGIGGGVGGEFVFEDGGAVGFGGDGAVEVLGWGAGD